MEGDFGVKKDIGAELKRSIILAIGVQDEGFSLTCEITITDVSDRTTKRM